MNFYSLGEAAVCLTWFDQLKCTDVHFPSCFVITAQFECSCLENFQHTTHLTGSKLAVRDYDEHTLKKDRITHNNTMNNSPTYVWHRSKWDTGKRLLLNSLVQQRQLHYWIGAHRKQDVLHVG